MRHKVFFSPTSSGRAHTEQQRIGRQLSLSVYKGVNYGAEIKSHARLLPACSLACFVSALVFSMLPWPAANHPASSSSTTRTLAKIGAERAVAACAVEANEAYTLSLLTTQNRLADKCLYRATRRQRSQSGWDSLTDMWERTLQLKQLYSWIQRKIKYAATINRD